MRSFAVLAFGVHAMVLGAACGSRVPPDDTSSASSSGMSSGFGGSSSGTGSSSGLVGADGCADATRLVYVISDGGDLYSFEPNQLRFAKKGTISCPGANFASPNSMAVDRTGIAWVNFSDGALFKVSITDARCEATTFRAGQSGFRKFGMAFASTQAGGTAETLFVAGLQAVGLPSAGGVGLAKIDTQSLMLSTIGDYPSPLTGRDAELTGTGDAKLYGFFDTSPATLAEIAQGSAATSGAAALSGVNTGIAYAFSFWGGDFWFYTTSSFTPSKVTRYKPSDRSVQTVVEDVGGFRIVGAGVSTCAPTSAPK